MLKRLKETEEKYVLLSAMLEDSAVIADIEKYTAILREYKALTPIVTKYREYLRAVCDVEEAQELLSAPDADIRILAQEELSLAKERVRVTHEQLQIMLLPRDDNDDKNIVAEIRACAGGDEAALFASSLFRMYSMYCERAGFKLSVATANETGLGGYREICFTIDGDGAYSRFKFESGVHRVQRVPETESQGRIQTSTATVAVLPEVEDVEIEIKDSDLIYESCKSSGAGGQHINKTESAVRLTHKPSGIVIECDQERSQFQNKAKALMLLRTMLYDQKCREQNEKIAADRKGQVGSGDRSEKIRTYNYPQSRVTDHRIGVSVFNIDAFVDGDMTPIIQPLMTAQAALDLQNSEN